MPNPFEIVKLTDEILGAGKAVIKTDASQAFLKESGFGGGAKSAGERLANTAEATKHGDLVFTNDPVRADLLARNVMAHKGLGASLSEVEQANLHAALSSPHGRMNFPSFLDFLKDEGVIVGNSTGVSIAKFIAASI